MQLSHSVMQLKAHQPAPLMVAVASRSVCPRMSPGKKLVTDMS